MDAHDLSVEQLKSMLAVKEAEEAEGQPASLARLLHARLVDKGIRPGDAATKGLYELADLVEKLLAVNSKSLDLEKVMTDAMRGMAEAMMKELHPVLLRHKERLDALEGKDE